MALVYIYIRKYWRQPRLSLHFIPEVDQGNTGLYIIDGQCFHNTSDFVLSEETPGLQYLLGNATLLILHCPSDL